MDIKIKLIAHGVPNGHDVWGNPGADAAYIETFYGRESDIPAQMLLEIMQFGGNTNAYYTYICNKNFQEKENRTGSYFALTLRINYYYSDIQNIYNLLDSAFKKYIVGTVVEKVAGGGGRFLVSQLKEANETFKDLEKEMQHYLMQFSTDADFVSLNGFTCNGKNSNGSVNLLEATPEVVAKHVKSTGKISVSPYHPTSREKQVINKKEAEVIAIKAEAKQQIDATQKKAKEEIETANRNANQSVQKAKEEKDKAIQEIRDEYKDADSTIKKLKDDKKTAQNKIASLEQKVDDLTTKLNTANRKLDSYKNSDTILNKCKNLITELKENLLGNDGILQLLDDDPDIVQKPKSSTKSSRFMAFIHMLHPFIDVFVMSVLLCIIALSLPKGCGNKKTSLWERIAINEKTEEPEQQQVRKQNETEEINDAADKTCTAETNTQNEGNEATNVAEYKEIPLKEKYPNAKILIEGASITKPIMVGQIYTVSLKNVDVDLGGKWVSEDLGVTKNTISVTKKGNCTLYYVVGKDTLATKTINVLQ